MRGEEDIRVLLSCALMKYFFQCLLVTELAEHQGGIIGL